MMMEEERVVCVTGAGGFVASWLVKLLLSNNYTVHGIARDPSDVKCEALKTLEKASENLKLFKGNLLDYESLVAAIKGCTGVFHVASPVPSGSVANPEVELMEPAVKGTKNVLQASSEAKVKRVVFVSSVAAVFLNPNWPADTVKDENCWSDVDCCKKTGGSCRDLDPKSCHRFNNWYCASKTEAEMAALEYGKRSGLDVVTVCPSHVFGPLMYSVANTSSLVLRNLLKEGYESTPNRLRDFVDVRDLAEALRIVYEKPEAEGRYICTAHSATVKELVDKLRSIYPNYNYPKSITGTASSSGFSSDKLQQLGWRYRSPEETLVDSVESYERLRL